MFGSASVFFDINLPNAPTWFYFSGLLAIALFVKFSRLLSVRNLDVLTIFLLTPGLLLLSEAPPNLQWGYLWLFIASGYYFLRCLLDLTLVRRPALSPNLTAGGLFWLTGALFISLVAVAAREPNLATNATETLLTPIDEVRLKGTTLFLPPAGGDPQDPEVRLWVERILTLLCHFAVVTGLVLIGWRHFEDVQSGAAAGAFYLLLPYTYLLVPGTGPGIGRWDHAWPMAVMVWAVLAYRRPTLSGAFLGLAAGTVVFPVVIFPIWLNFYRGRGAGRFVLAFLVVTGLCVAGISGWFWLNGQLPESLRAWRLSTWLPWWEPATAVPNFWSAWGIHWAYRIPVFILYLAFLLPTFFWPASKNLAQVLALSAAALIGIQFWYADQGGVYVLWYLPFLLLLVFRPNLVACQPPVRFDNRWFLWGRTFARLWRRTLRHAEPATEGKSPM